MSFPQGPSNNLSPVLMIVVAAVFTISGNIAVAEEPVAQSGLEAAAQTSLGGPGSASAQQEQDRLRRLEDSRWPGLDRSLDPTETALGRFRENTGLALSFDYQALYQRSSHSLTGQDAAASGQLRMIGTWELADRGGENPGSLVFILENRHRLGQPIAPSAMAAQIGYQGATAVTFSDTDTTLSVAYWQQAVAGGRGGVAVGRIDPGDYSDILGYVNPRTTFSNYSILFSPVLPIPDPGFGIAAGGYLTDQFYALGLVSDANGSLTDVEWFPGGSEFYKYAEIGWTPQRSKRFLTNVHLGMFHTDERQKAGVPETYGGTVSANHTFENQLMIFGRLGWSNGGGALAERAVNAGLMWRPGTYDDLFGLAATVADLTTPGLPNQTTIEAFYRLDLADNLALTADVQYLNNPGSNPNDPLVFGLRLRVNL
ncbi:carbohydrate porin [Ruegeria sp. HKCCA6837]|uniref:carbohydrate porin n=1 Tax=Ruegeria sp. HKCCA6837 TaxID=2682989 RepID=UPI00148825F6|nr:carbohydrate porin [Ruegeria sp. HKCCA6837]